MEKEMIIIDNWRRATERVAMVFTKKYFKGNKYGEDTFWVADEIGGVFCVSDYFFNIDRIIEALESKATWEQLVDYYNLETEHAMEHPDLPTPINFRNYVKYGLIGEQNENSR